TKLKATAWGLLLAASMTIGAVALTYRPAAAQPAPKADPAAAAKAANPDELEALRLEVEALRLDLKATKARVQALESRAQAPAVNERNLDLNAPQGKAGPQGSTLIWPDIEFSPDGNRIAVDRVTARDLPPAARDS